MPLPLLFVGIAAASGMLGIGGAVKAGVDTNNAKRINKNANKLVQQSTDCLNAQRLACGNALTQLGAAGGRKAVRPKRNTACVSGCIYADQKCGFRGNGRAG